MDQLRFTGEILAGYLTEGILTIVFPIILLIVWKKKTGAALKPAVTGMIVFPLFGILLKLIPAYFLLIADNPVSRAITSNIWLYSVIGGGLLAGVFEEGGRFIAFKTVLKNNRSRQDAVSYGIGHGGFESAYLGVSVLGYFAMGMLINNGGLAMLTAGMGEADAEALKAQLSALSSGPFYFPAVLGTFERVTAVVFHISMSVFNFAAARDRKYILLFPCAILLHTLMNSTTAFYSTGMVSALVLELVLAAFAGIVAVLAYRLYKKLDE